MESVLQPKKILDPAVIAGGKTEFKPVSPKAKRVRAKKKAKPKAVYGEEAFKLIDSVIGRSVNFHKPLQMKSVAYDLPYSLVPIDENGSSKHGFMVCNRFGFRIGSNHGVRISPEWCVKASQVDLSGLIAGSDGSYILYSLNPSSSAAAMKVALSSVKRVFRIPEEVERKHRRGAYKGVVGL